MFLYCATISFQHEKTVTLNEITYENQICQSHSTDAHSEHSQTSTMEFFLRK